MSVAFWSATVKAGTPVEVQPPEGFVLNLQQAALTGSKSGAAILKVKTIAIEGEEIDAVIGTLRNTTADQINLSLVFGYDVPATFSLSGDSHGTVHLSGYYQPGPDGDEEEGDEFDGDDEDGEEDSEDEEDDDEHTAKMLKELAKHAASSNKSSKGKVVQLPSESEEDSEEESEDEKPVASTKKPATPFKSAAPVPADSEEDSEEDSEDEEDSEGSEQSESEDEAPPVKVQKTQPKGVVTSSGSNSNNKQQQSNKAPQQHQQQNKSNPNTPNKAAFGSGKPAQQQQSKTPQSGNKPQQHGGNNNKHQQSGDKRKR